MFAAEAGTNARGWCRQCHYFSWADEGQEPLDPERIEKANRERVRLLQDENLRIRDKLRRIADSDFWRRWHSEMTAEQRKLWHRQGVIDFFIDYYNLGYCADHTTYYDGQEWHSPTMTIPHYWLDWELVNIQHRLLRPPEAGDKYRQMAGVPASLFLTEPEERLTGAVLVVEGAKKAIVTYTHLGTEPLGFRLNVVAVPSKTPSGTMLDQLKDADPVYLMLDPDAYLPAAKGRRAAVATIARKLSPERVRLIKLPAKPDDFFTMYGGETDDMAGYLKSAVKA